MLAGDLGGLGEEQFPEEEAWEVAGREIAHIPVGTARHLAANRPKWEGGDFGETIYVYTPRIMGIIGNDSMGRKIDREVLVEAGMVIPLGGNGEIGKQYP